MNVTVEYYSYLKTIFGRESTKIKVDNSVTINELLTKLSRNLDDDARKVFGDVNQGFKILTLVNKNLVNFDYSLKEGDKISLLIPLDGG